MSVVSCVSTAKYRAGDGLHAHDRDEVFRARAVALEEQRAEAGVSVTVSHF
jgi:hypothetical protein